VVLLLSVSQ
jgi:hypothetical protein